MDLRELLQVSPMDALQFFLIELRETPAARDLSRAEALHVASVLAHHAQVSWHASALELPAPSWIPAFLDHLVWLEKMRSEEAKDQPTMLLAATQCLFVMGFYPKFVGGRRERRYVEAYGAQYYRQTSRLSQTRMDMETYHLMSRNFGGWVKACHELQVML